MAVNKRERVAQVLDQLSSVRKRLDKLRTVLAYTHDEYMREYMRINMRHRRKHKGVLTEPNGTTFAERRATMLERTKQGRLNDPDFIAARGEYLRKKGLINEKRDPLEREKRKLMSELRMLRAEGWYAPST